jgi:multiple sugar transport system substrate-binding protein
VRILSAPVTRRSVLVGGAALATSILARHGTSLAQELSGSIRVGYEGANPFIGTFAEAAAEAVMAANPGATIEVQPSTGANYLNQIAVQLMMGTAPDVFLLIGLGSGELATGGLVIPLDDYLAGWDGWEQYDEDARFGVTVQGHTWSIPWGLDVYFLFYRKDLFAAAGLPTNWQPATREEIIDAAAAVKAANPDVIPYSLYAGANGEIGAAADFLNLISSNGGTLTDAEGHWYIGSCPIQHTLEYYETAFQTAQVVPQSVMTDVNPIETVPAAMGAGELGILHETVKHFGTWLSEDPANAQQIGIAHFPGDNGAFSLADAGDAWYINSKSENPDLGWAFIEAINSAEMQAALAVDDPHLPARLDARAISSWASLPLSQAMLAAASSLILPPPEPQFRKLIGVVQNATSLVATGQASPKDAIVRYSDELTRTMGKMNVVSDPCP